MLQGITLPLSRVTEDTGKTSAEWAEKQDLGTTDLEKMANVGVDNGLRTRKYLGKVQAE